MALFKADWDRKQIDNTPAVQEAEAWKCSVTPLDGVDYGWVYDYAVQEFERLAKVYDRLDEKANEIMKHLGGGTGVVTLAALANVSHSNVKTIALLIPAAIVSILSILFALAARMPSSTGHPPSTKIAFNYAGYYHKENGSEGCPPNTAAKGAFAAQFNKASEEMAVAIGLKAWRVGVAGWLYWCTVVLLLLALSVAVRWSWPGQ